MTSVLVIVLIRNFALHILMILRMQFLHGNKGQIRHPT